MNLRSFLSIAFFVFVLPVSAQQLLTVQDAVVVGLQKNYDVMLQQNTALTAFSDQRFSVGVFLPNINADGAYTKQETNSRAVTASDVETVRTGVKSTNMNGAVRLVWTLFDGTQMFAIRKRINLTADWSEIEVKNQMNNTAATIINSYYGIIRQKQQLKAIQEQMSVSEERVKLAERKLQVGTGGKPEYLQAKVDLNAFRTAAIRQESLIIQLKDQLNGLLGMSLTDPFETTDSIEIDLGMTMEQITQDIENTNIPLISARKQIEVAEAILWEARAGRSPIINFVSNYTFNKNENAQAASPVSLLFSRNYGFNYGVSVSIPLLNNLNVSSTVNRSKINLDRQKLLYDAQLALATTSVRVAFTNYDNARRTLVIQEENILLAKENVTIMLESFKRSIATFIELRTAQQSLADATNSLIAARYDAKLAETELLRLKGALVQ
jgi:outer membrane protein